MMELAVMRLLMQAAECLQKARETTQMGSVADPCINALEQVGYAMSGAASTGCNR